MGGTLQRRLELPDPRRKTASHLYHPQFFSEQQCCIKPRRGQIWIGTDGGGINILDPETGQFSLLEHIPGRDNYSLPANSILCLYNDRNNNMWAGSIRNGLISIREVSMKTYKDVFFGKNARCIARQ